MVGVVGIMDEELMLLFCGNKWEEGEGRIP